MMNDFNDFKKWIETGNEVEFSYGEKRYSLTYGRKKNGAEYISFCEFYKPDMEFADAADFMSHAKINDRLLKEIWKDVTDITVF